MILRTVFALLAAGAMAAEPFCTSFTSSAPRAYEISGPDLHPADLDGDGNTDLVASSEILYGRGDGTLGAAEQLEGGYATVLPADFDGDGRIDLVGHAVRFTFGLSAVHELVLLRNEGNRRFSRSLLVSRGRSHPLVVADFNKDNRLDIVFGTIFTGTEDGRFTTRVSAPLLSAATAADINGDGNLDLLGIEPDGKTARVHLGDGRGNFAFGFPLGSEQAWRTVIGDFNGDEQSDVAVLSDPSIAIYHGPFGSEPQPALRIAVRGAMNGVARDFDGDGVDELAVAEWDRIHIYKPDGAILDRLPTMAFHRAIASADSDNDGADDLVLQESYLAAAIIPGNGDGTFRTRGLRAAGAAKPGPIAAVGDLNGDGVDEVASYSTRVHVGRITAPGVATYEALPAEMGEVLAIGDVSDVTGGAEVIAAKGKTIHVAGHRNGAWEIVATYQVQADVVALAARERDIVYIADKTLARIPFGGTPQLIERYIVAGDGFRIRVADVDRDGRQDLVVMHAGTPTFRGTFDTYAVNGSVFVYRMRADGTFAPRQLLLNGYGMDDVAIGDFTSDGRNDAAVSTDDGGVLLTHGDGSGGFGAAQKLLDWKFARLAAHDLDGDGDEELAVRADKGLALFLGAPGTPTHFDTYFTGNGMELASDVFVARLRPGATPALLTPYDHWYNVTIGGAASGDIHAIEFDCRTRRRAVRGR